MILNSLSQVRSMVINTIVGTELAIMYLGKIFVSEKVYDTVNDAIAGCKRDVDMGMGILITPDAKKFRVWIAIPQELVL
ncbi:hypothetical protein HCU40_09960 [Pseudanabaena biceps]|nr:hypothetical protein [Pseudanabaena biceps]